MSQTFGGEKPRPHHHMPLRKPARYLVLIDSGGFMVARLFLDTLELVAEFDPSIEETAPLILGLSASMSAAEPLWDHALEGHSAAERAEAQVYTLPV